MSKLLKQMIKVLIYINFFIISLFACLFIKSQSDHLKLSEQILFLFICGGFSAACFVKSIFEIVNYKKQIKN